jgi:hypothetical protein
MLKTEHNLKVLEKKVRQAAHLIDELRKDKSAPLQKKAAVSEKSYHDLPLLHGVRPSGSSESASSLSDGEREQLKTRIVHLLEEIEDVLE